MRSVQVFPILGALTAVACAKGMHSPAPSVNRVTPPAVCVEQLTTTATVTGAGLTPVPRGVLTNDPRIVLPRVILTRGQDLLGAKVSAPSAELSDDPEHPEQSTVAWLSSTTMRIRISPATMLEPGLYGLTVDNRDGSSFFLPEAILGVARPRLLMTSPDLLCSDRDNLITLTGEGFIKGPGGTVPAIQAGGLVLAPDSLSDCQPLPGSGQFFSCKTMTVRLAKKSLPPGRHALLVTNPGPVGCLSTETVEVVLVPEPSLVQVDPELISDAQEDRPISVTGSGFLSVDGVLPTLRAGNLELPVQLSGCTDVQGTRERVQSCTSLAAVIAHGSLPAGIQPLAVLNPSPADCISTDAVNLVVVPVPQLRRITPDIACTSEHAVKLTLSGSGFLEVDGHDPRVSLGTTTLESSAGNCTIVQGLTRTTALSCSTLTTTVARGSLPPGSYPAVVTNPSPADGYSEESVSMRIEPPPSLASLAPDIICREQAAQTLALTGSSFLSIQDPGQAARSPVVRFTDEATAGTATVAGVVTSSCAAVSGLRENLGECSRLSVNIPPGTLSEGLKRVTVENPAPADCTSNEVQRLVSVSRPVITGLSVPAICSTAAERQVTIHGSGFLVLGASSPPDQVPAVSFVQGSTRFNFASPRLSSPAAVVPSGCRPLMGTRLPVQICTDLAVRIPAGAAVGTYTVSVSNAVAECVSTDSAHFSVALSPVISSASPFQPQNLCTYGGTLTIRGSNFVEGAVVSFGGVRSLRTTASADGTTLVATFGDLSSLATNQSYPVTVRNAAGCETTAGSTVRLDDSVYTYFVDPSVVYNGVNTRITLFTSGILARPIAVHLQNAANGTVLDYSDADVLWDSTRPSRVQVIVPRDSAQRLVPPGAWAATAFDGRGCGVPMAGAFSVTNRLGVGLVSITPPFGATTENTAIVLKARASSTTTPPLELFQRTPRAYLNPSSNPGAPATELSSVAFVADGSSPQPDLSATLTAIVPNQRASLPVGAYDVLVVNPDGAVGLLRSAYRVTSLPAPSIDTIVPGSISRAPGQAVQIQGSRFRMAAACLNAAGAEDSCVRLRCGPIGVSAPTKLPATTVTAATASTINITIDASALSTGDACAVRVTNGDGTYTDFSAVTVSNPSSGNNPIAFVPVPPMLTGRRAPAAVGARVTSAARFVYAVGGDRGSDDLALASVESAPVGMFGGLGSWFRIPIDLPAPRTRAGIVRIDRFLYLVGGHVPGAGDVAGVLRAMVLDPADAPAMNDPDLRIIQGQPGGMPAGVFYYRVSAVLSASDPANPGGETLASDPVVIRAPSIRGNEVVFRLSWAANPRASAYRIYRTPASDQASGQERLACVVPAGTLEYVDDNNPASHTPACVANAQVSPLPLGSTGVWTDQIPDTGGTLLARPLQLARASAGLAVATDRTSSSIRHIYAVGGQAAGSYRNTYEHLTVQINSPSSQSVAGGWTLGAQTLTARSELQTVVADASTAPAVGSNVCVFALAGRTGATTSTGRVEVSMLPSGGGELLPWISTFVGPGQSNVSGSPAGFGAALSSNTIFVFGGAGGGGTTPGGGGVSRALATPDPACTAFASSFNGLGAINLRARYLGGTAIQSGFVYVIGGATSAGSVTCGDGSSDSGASSCVVDGSVLGGQP